MKEGYANANPRAEGSWIGNRGPFISRGRVTRATGRKKVQGGSPKKKEECRDDLHS